MDCKKKKKCCENDLLVPVHRTIENSYHPSNTYEAIAYHYFFIIYFFFLQQENRFEDAFNCFYT